MIDKCEIKSRSQVPIYGKPLEKPNATMSDLLADQYSRDYLDQMHKRLETEERRS